MSKKHNVGNIRLSKETLSIICQLFSAYFLPNDHLWLFGSRANPLKKGGDIDLYIETYFDNYDIAIERKISFLCELKKKIGEQKIDVVLHLKSKKDDLPIHNIAKSTGVRII